MICPWPRPSWSPDRGAITSDGPDRQAITRALAILPGAGGVYLLSSEEIADRIKRARVVLTT